MGALSKRRSESRQQSLARSQQASRQFIDPSQVPFLQDLRTSAQQLAQQQSQQIGGIAAQLTGALGGIGGDLLGSLQRQSQAAAPGLERAQRALQRAGQQGPSIADPSLSAIAQGGAGGAGLDFQGLIEPGAALEGQIDFLEQAVQRNLASTLGTTAGQASLAGQIGGDREAFFATEAGRQAQETFGAAASDLFQADLAQRRQLASQLQQTDLQARLQAGLGQQQNLLQQQLGQQANAIAAAQAAGGLGLQQQAQQAAAAQAGLGSLAGLYNLGLAPFQAQFAPLQALAGIIGPPTVLGTSVGQSMARSMGRAESRGFGFGLG